MNPLRDDELDRALETWRVPDAPSPLEARVLDVCRSDFRRISFWRRLLTMRVPVPLPAVAAVIVLLVCLSVTLTRAVQRSRAAGQPAAAGVSDDLPTSHWGGLQPVAELRPRVIRGQGENH